LRQVYHKFISLGPFCLSASILESAKLRDGSYPLDWAQSGYTTISELVELDKEAFYYRNIYTPSVHFYQIETESLTDLFPLVSSANTNIFGYPYFYNPHKKLGVESKEYFMRTLDRWDKVTSSACNVTFLLTDYTNNPGNIFFDDALQKLKPLSTILSSKLCCKHRIILIRLRLACDQLLLCCDKVEILDMGILQIDICYPTSYQKTQELHDLAVRIIGRLLNTLLEAWIDDGLQYVSSSISFARKQSERTNITF
jgi:hypothetical protein